MTPEGKVKKALDAYLKSQKVYVFAPVQTGRGKRTVDRVCCVDGYFIGIEAKATADKKPTALQMKTLKDIKAAGGKAMIVWFDKNERLIWECL